MTTATAQVAGMGQFWLQDGDSPPPVDSWDQSSGLAVTAAVGAVIVTGEAYGPITVTVDVRPTVPAEAEDPLAFDRDIGWDDIVEISVNCAEGPLRVCALDAGFSDELPSLGPKGAGTHRIRVHVRGRDSPDTDADGMPVPTDQFLIVAWPAPPRPPLNIRLSDLRGLSTRIAWLEARGR